MQAARAVVSGPTIQVSTGGYVDLVNPHPDDIQIEDIARALSNICRYTGHVSAFYSVAQHSVLCCENAPDEHKWSALMHDAAEAFVGDVSRPLKHLIPDYKVIERRMEAVLAKKYGIIENDVIKRLDREALATEQRDLMPRTGDTWEPTIGFKKWGTRIIPWTPDAAYRAFMVCVNDYSPVGFS